MLRTLRFSSLMELLNALFEVLFLATEILRLGDLEFLVGRTIARERPVIGKLRAHQWAEQPPDKDARQVELSASHIHRCAAVSHHLGDIHLSPLPLRGRL